MAAVRIDFIVNAVRILLGEDDDAAENEDGEVTSTRTSDEAIVVFLKMVLWEKNANMRSFFDDRPEEDIEQAIDALSYEQIDENGQRVYPEVPMNLFAVKAVVSDVFSFLQIRDQNIIRPEQALLQQELQRKK